MAWQTKSVGCVLLCCTLQLACGELMNKQYMYTRKTSGTLYRSPYSTSTEMCTGRSCKLLSCAKECAEGDRCVVFSYNRANRSCILSRRPDNDPVDYETANPDSNTYYRMCPTWKGYNLNTSHNPPLCLKSVLTQILNYQEARAACQEDEADLVRVKSLDVYNIVKDILVASGETRHVLAGADDIETEQVFHWNDGTRLYQGTNLWLSSAEGYDAREDCVCFSATEKLLDTICSYRRPFICQYDV